MREITPADIKAIKNTSWVAKHKWFILFLFSFYIFGMYLILNTPQGWSFPKLKSTYALFAPSLVAFVLISYIGGYLLYRYYINPITKSEIFFQLSWGLSFFVYGILFFGLCLQALSISFADMTKPEIFFLWRLPMIFWVSGMWVGTALLFSERTNLVYLSGMLINIIGIGLYVNGLLINKDISSTMYIFLYTLFIPLCLIIAYFWWVYAGDTKMNSPRLLALGFLLMGFSYSGWAPWHFEEVSHVYYIFYQFFILSLSFILAGFYGLPKEITIKYSR